VRTSEGLGHQLPDPCVFPLRRRAPAAAGEAVRGSGSGQSTAGTRCSPPPVRSSRPPLRTGPLGDVPDDQVQGISQYRSPLPMDSAWRRYLLTCSSSARIAGSRGRPESSSVNGCSQRATARWRSSMALRRVSSVPWRGPLRGGTPGRGSWRGRAPIQVRARKLPRRSSGGRSGSCRPRRGARGAGPTGISRPTAGPGAGCRRTGIRLMYVSGWPR